MACIRSSPANKSQNEYWSSESYDLDLFSRSGSYNVVMLPPGEIFNRDFVIDEMLERCDEHQSETRKNRIYDTF
jgi:hypothetical protein